MMVKNDEYLEQFIATKKDDLLAMALLTTFKDIHRDCVTSESQYSALLKQKFEELLTEVSNV